MFKAGSFFLLCFQVLFAGKILVTGGQGFIGSHVTQMLIDHGYETVVLDLVGGDVQGDVRDGALLDRVFQEHEIDAVMHFAACIRVGESVVDPLKYYDNNVVGTIALLGAMRRAGVDKVVFSSSAAVYGQPEDNLVETHGCQPMSPYGRTKRMIEQVLFDMDEAYGCRSVALRYFNAAGGDPSGRVKNHNIEEANLIPIVLKRLKAGKRSVTVFGTDYDTPDGTCVRDYVHVDDLARAHKLALEHLLDGGDSKVYNLGSGCGISVQEVLDAIKRYIDIPFEVIAGERRQGDVGTLIADSTKAHEGLGWEPKYDLDAMIRHAWKAMN